MKIIIVPHTHWDREWYFTNETSQSLLNFNLDNCFNYDYPIRKFYLDGQVSLVEDYLNHANPVNKQKFIEHIKQRKLIIGPLYSQPDVFNSLGETTMRNIELAQDLLTTWKLPNTDIFYCPDTFGFCDNLPQILNLYEFKDFVFWRGVAKQTNDDDTFIWKGIEGSQVNCYRLKFGYWTLGSMFPWKILNAKNVKECAQEFLKAFILSPVYKHFQKQAQKQNGIVVFPFGGDQAPIHPLTNEFFDALNLYSKDQWVIGEFNELFKHHKPFKTITGTLDYGFDSKIHRTISSTRYDFKKAFRDNEIALYHQLEPLELFYQNSDHKYVSNNQALIKKLCLMQAHDVLGGCVTDDVYTASYQNLINLKEEIATKQMMLMKQLALQLDLNNQQLLVFNPHVSNHANNVKTFRIYTSKPLSGWIKSEAYSMYVLKSEPYQVVDESYVSDVLFINKSLKPMNLETINYADLKAYEVASKKFDQATLYNQFYVSYDHGDLFDADEIIDKRPAVKNTVLSAEIIKLDDVDCITITGVLCIDSIENNYVIKVYKLFNNDEYIDIDFNNHSKDIIVKWLAPKNLINPSHMQHLAVQKYKPRTCSDWVEQGYKDNPLNVEKNNGLIFDNNNYVCTSGTNEFSYADHKLLITLYRSTGYLGKANLINRPGCASGLTDHHIKTPLGQLNKTLHFNFKCGSHHNDVHHKLNSFYQQPIIFQVGAKDLISSKMERFVFLKQTFDVQKFTWLVPEGYVTNFKPNKTITVINWNLDSITYLQHKIHFNQIEIVKLKHEA